ncbi:hypothetical protein Mapa_016597 [Marchantia paleacea]|nr:hypothetical protein Mapa_016597 [Marchantia paleacea]
MLPFGYEVISSKSSRPGQQHIPPITRPTLCVYSVLSSPILHYSLLDQQVVLFPLEQKQRSNFRKSSRHLKDSRHHPAVHIQHTVLPWWQFHRFFFSLFISPP